MDKNQKSRLEYLKKKIEESNQAFKNATKAEKREMILKDALAFSNLENTLITTGDYGTFVVDGVERQIRELGDQAILKSKQVKCYVCAKGAMLCSRIRLGNKFEMDDASSEGSIEALSGIFSADEMNWIEAFFERDLHHATGDAGKVFKKYLGLTENHLNRITSYSNVFENYVYSKYPDNDNKRFQRMIKNILWADGNVLAGLFRYPASEATLGIEEYERSSI